MNELFSCLIYINELYTYLYIASCYHDFGEVVENIGVMYKYFNKSSVKIEFFTDTTNYYLTYFVVII